MRLTLLVVINIITFFLFTFNSKATICTSVAPGGNWSAPETWSCGSPPTCGDTIYINHTVTLTSNVDLTGCAVPTYIVINSGGELHFNNGKKLKLPCNSGVTLMAGSPSGTITADGYSGNSESLQICGAVAWQAGFGQANGPLVYGSGLPIELVSFSAYYSDKDVHIRWTTATETNSDYFLVQRSTDGMNWTDEIHTSGAGNSNSLVNYFEIDFSPLEGTSYYRLKQVDYDGHITYGPNTVVKNYNQLSGELTVYPNPCDGLFQIQLGGFEDEEVLIVVRDVVGRESFSKTIIASTHTMEAFDLSACLAAGTYIVTASNNRNEFYSQKLIVR